MIIRTAIVLGSSLLLGSAAQAQSRSADAAEALSWLEPITGQVWVGTPTAAGMTHQDVARWDVVIEGVAIQSTHSIGNGVYGGTTLFYYDHVQNRLAFSYITNAGFNSTGYITRNEEGILDVVETIHGSSEVSEVRAQIRIGENSWQTRSLYLVGDEWLEGDGHDYQPAPASVLVSFQPDTPISE